MHPQSASTYGIKKYDMVTESNRVIKYKPISGWLHELSDLNCLNQIVHHLK